ncbi:hypothetical protein SBRCBS47491_003964 [Sporothrix bragantina]|uniref:C6 transcription factor RegA n=1 Tax=Sporothrix bragantina TaxID=671064 RepID=A0ABP0BJH0_9PEZI
MDRPGYNASPVAAGHPTATATTTHQRPSTTTTPATTGTTTTTYAEGTNLFQCGSCKRQYKRLDHLARHVRSHTQSRPYRCHVCTKAFARADLLKRHVAGHEARNDAVSTTSRHSTTPSISGSNASNSTAAAGRVSRACQACSSNHLRCSEEKPCKRCTTKNLTCVWDRAVDMVVTPPATVVTATSGEEEDETADTEDVVNAAEMQPPPPPQVPEEDMERSVQTPMTANLSSTMSGMNDLATPHLVPASQMTHLEEHTALDPPQSFLRMLSAFDFSYKAAGQHASAGQHGQHTSTSLLPQEAGTGHGQWTPMGALDFDATAAGSLDLDLDHLDDMDFRFLDAYNTRVPFEFGVSPTTGGDGVDVHRPDASVSGSQQGQMSTATPGYTAAIGSGSEAFKRHYWKFRPNAQDYCGAEEHNLSLPAPGAAGAVDHTSPESTLSQALPPKRPDGMRLNTASRDKILMVVTHNCLRENVARVVTSFPSVELLDTLVQFYLMSPVAQASTFLHTASFHRNPNEKRPELLAAMTAAGAVLTGDPALSKLGFAIQECLRIAVPQQWERDNTLTRDLELGQAYLLTLDMALWSGRSRKVEIAESFFMPLLTMRRRDGCFGRSGRASSSSSGVAALSTDDFGQNLHDKWKAWIHQESVTRFAFRLLQHDTYSSMALLTTPLISYAEILLTFPAALELWSAPTPEQWKTLFLAQQQMSRPPTLPATLPAFLENPDAFMTIHKGRIDMKVVCVAFLSCAWGLTWEYVQLSVLQREMSSSSSSLFPSSSSSSYAAGSAGGVTGASQRRWNAFVMGSRQDEILQLIQAFRTACANTDLSHPVMTMRTELVLMHTHTVLEQVQLFAGMEGPDQARAVHPVILEWVASESARKSLWHAGQILRAARQLARGLIGGPTAVMVYHAGLTLWIYGAVSQSLLSPTEASGGDDLFMDGPDTGIALQRFFARGHGRPCIGGVDGVDGDDEIETIPLCQPDRVMGVVSGIFRRNHDKTSRPHMVDSLVQLIDEIQRASTATMATAIE